MRSGRRAIEPSSRMISHSTAAGVRPASRARSQQASVWPARTNTPPGCAISGNTWPGWTMSSGRALSEAATLTVSARSCAEMPVAMPSAASIELVKLVPWRERLCSTIGRRPSRCACACVIGMHTRPRPCFARKLIFSGVTNSAAKTRSPSFSRSSSSTSTTISPPRMAALISVRGLMAAVWRRISRFSSCPCGLFLGRGDVFGGALALADTSRLARARAQVVELGASHFAFALHLNRGDERRIRLERALDALARGNLAHDEGGVEALVALGDHHAFEGLRALALALDDVDVDDHRVARPEVGHGLLQALDLFLLKFLDQIHARLLCSCWNSASSFFCSSFSVLTASRSGLRSQVRPSACFRRQRRMFS